MPLKSWILDKVNRVNELFVRDDLPPQPPAGRAPGVRVPLSAAAERGGALPADDTQAGLYEPLVEAIREELERFVAAHVRHHLAIAEHDRFLLTSIEIATEDEGEPAELLRRFRREFKPEQIKRYLMREVIGALPNASAIDLSQFAGLTLPAPGPAAAGEADDDEYAELLKALADPGPGAARGAYRVTLAGRWAEGEPPPASVPAAAPTPAATPATAAASPVTPLAGTHAGTEIDVGDAGGERHVTLAAVLPGRRYVVGKDSGCDIVVEGTYTSRRHCELWFDQGRWWVLDAGSTNGIRVESAAGVQRSGGPEAAAGAARPLPLVPGERVVLSALAQGRAEDHPWLALRAPQAAAVPSTPLAAAGPLATPATPITPIVAAPRRAAAWTLSAQTVSGTHSVELAAQRLPVGIGRSRRQTLAIDLAHESVSGHHLDVVALDDEGAEILVHGANGVTLGGVAHEAGSRLRWRAGEPLTLGRPAAQEPPCTLQLARRADASAPTAP